MSNQYDIYALPFVLYALVLVGILLAAITMYLMRTKDVAEQQGGHIRDHVDKLDFAIELVFAGGAGYIGLFVALYAGLSPPGLVVAATGAAYLNRSFYLLITKYGSQLVIWWLEKTFGIRFNRDKRDDAGRDL